MRESGPRQPGGGQKYLSTKAAQEIGFLQSIHDRPLHFGQMQGHTCRTQSVFDGFQPVQGAGIDVVDGRALQYDMTQLRRGCHGVVDAVFEIACVGEIQLSSTRSLSSSELTTMSCHSTLRKCSVPRTQFTSAMCGLLWCDRDIGRGRSIPRGKLNRIYFIRTYAKLPQPRCVALSY